MTASLEAGRRLRFALVLVAGVLASCRGDFSVTVDSSLVPSVKDVPGWAAGERRPVAVFATESGQTVEFIEDEVLLAGLDTAARDALISRTGATVLREMPASAHGLAGVGDLVLIRVDPSRLETRGVEDALAAVATARNRHATGHYRVSSETALRLVGLAAAEVRDGAQVALNVRGQGAAIPDFTVEALVRPDGVSRDAYTWPHLARGTALDYGTAEAWSLLYRAGKLGFRIKIAVIDGGFARNNETRPRQAYSVTTAGAEPLGTENPNTCTGGSACPWHGQSVVSTCCGLVDDEFGGAGTAGPIAEPIVVYLAIETYAVAESMLVARAAGARIINMSFSMGLPWIVDWVSAPIDLVAAGLRSDGVLLFAASGNAGEDVDSEGACFADLCWEDTYHVPCESPAVICVGGMAETVGRAAHSNYGARDVRVYGPFSVLAGPDPTTDPNSVHWTSGTSLSSPYVAGVAGLVWAADPEQTADEVATELTSVVHVTPAWMNEARWVSPRGAVLHVLGGTAAARITEPEAGADLTWGLPVELAAHLEVETFRVTTPSCTVRWSSDVSGALIEKVVTLPSTRNARPATLEIRDTVTSLRPGVQLLRFDAACTAEGATFQAAATRPIRVLNSAPVVTIESPVSGTQVCAGQAVLLRGAATDVNQPTGLPDSAFVWRSSRDGALGTGASRTVSTLSVGTHVLSLTVTDSAGLTALATATLGVRSATAPECSNTPPTAHIVAPVDGTWLAPTGNDGEWYVELDLVGTGSDLETPPASLQYQWRTDRTEGLLGTGATRHVRLHVVGGVTTTHTLTLRVTDGAGNSAEDHVHLTIEVLF